MRHRSLGHLEAYIGPGETIHLYFRPCLKHIQFDVAICVILVTILSVIFWGQWALIGVLLVGLILAVLYFLIHYWCTEYFVTEKALYHKYFFWMSQIRYLDKGDILEMNVRNHFFERWMSHSATICINSPSGQNWEIHHVRHALEKKNFILKLWDS